MISRLHVVSLLVVTCSVGVVVACSDKETGCTVDLDCGQGSFCRDGVCASVGVADAGPTDAQVAIACVSSGGSCTFDDECCTRPCTSFRCSGGTPSSSGKTSSGASGTSGTSGTSGSTSSGGNCVDLYGLCASDFECCTGLSCLTGTCR